ncbi:hypothetical protein IV38_GL001476 [Lactobacillus selangorensis]|uniref:PDZ domain-containing protein n=1 Tax=Lactobacillus selangorensis TaxID=81857 RepID=A0A0R2FL84_9LACO|nr:PDZ domain-containing protein [Lactobacillus selangorensis]KRN28475.1 hypothetical protein IV38_GL001476 [Lactobacillus selangorensis]KRN31975.1 hypothetical protein IV40_GL001262 [Lactobacillus selangorensis]
MANGGIYLAMMVLQPALWLGIAAVYFWAIRRVHTERRTFRIAIQNRIVEIKTFWLSGLVGGLLTSVMMMLAGATLPVSWLVGYQVLIPVVFLFVLQGVNFVAGEMLLSAGLFIVSALHLLSVPVLNVRLVSTVLLMGGCMAFMAAWGFLRSHVVITPQIETSRRGRQVANYRASQFFLMPTLFLIPGGPIHAAFSWWPALTLGGQQYDLWLVPLFAGFSYLMKQQLPKTGLQKAGRAYLAAGLLLIVAAIAAFFWASAALWLLGLGVIIAFWPTFRMIRNNQTGAVFFTQTNAGVRVVAVVPGTPAEKMGLESGDVIVSCNQEPVHDEDSFYQAIEKSATFCKLRVQTMNGEYKLAESAVFTDSPHELGVILFPER